MIRYAYKHVILTELWIIRGYSVILDKNLVTIKKNTISSEDYNI